MSLTLRSLLETIGAPKSAAARARTRRAVRPDLMRQLQRLEERTLLSTFTVTNTLDNTKTGSLRWAITEVNADKGHTVDTINFKIPGTGPFTISPTSALPAITHSVFINGYSESHSSANTATDSDNAVILIQLSGTSAGFSDGLQILAGNSTVSGLAINQFEQYGIRLYGGGNDVISGDFVGTDPTGSTALPNIDAGISVDNSKNDVIGGTAAAARNIVSGNTNQNIYIIDNASGALVEGNFVGLTAAGTSTLSDNGNGVSVIQATNNTIGGTAAGAGNVISGHTFDGVTIDEASGNVVQGNKIGTDPTGEVALGNEAGVLVGYASAADNLIGGAAQGAGNLISGNYADGILIATTLGTGNAIEGNLIGTDATGENSLGNGGDGMIIEASGVSVGGIGAGAANVISGNGQYGIVIEAFSSYGVDLQANDNLVEGNKIGTNAAGNAGVGNAAGGVAIFGDTGGAVANSIGGTAQGAGNVIAYNGGNGVTIGSYTFDSGAVDDSILSNLIYANSSLGIDLGNDGVTPNNSGPDGPNLLQNYPDLGGAAAFPSSFAVVGTLNAAPSTTYTIQLYGNPAADPSGYGQGQYFLGTFSVTTNSSGTAALQFGVPSVPAGVQFVSATATDPNGNTSEFSADIPVVSTTSTIAAGNDSYYTDTNTTLTVPAPGVQANDIAENLQPFTSVVVTNPSDGTVTLNSDGAFTYVPKANFLGTDTFTYEDVQGSNTSNIATVTITVLPKVFVVTNTNDSGSGSLRQALFYANLSNSPPPDTIEFDIPGTGPFVINPLSPLPAVEHPTIIDGYSQPGASANTLAVGDNAVILIQIDGSQAANTDGLTLTGGGSVVSGLAITDFADGIDLTDAGGDSVTGNFIGTDPTGEIAEGNNDGIYIDNTGSNTIGGTTPDARNIVSSNSTGIYITNGLTNAYSSGNQILGNYIGTDATGQNGLGGFEGIILTAAPDTTVGGSAPGAGNVISDNFYGIYIFSTTQGPDNSTIQGNLIGTNASDTAALGNLYAGLLLDGGNNLLIGGSSAGDGNVVSGTVYDDGIDIETDNALIQGNWIGTDATGTISIPNAIYGIVALYFTSGATIGGTTAGAGNLISNNGASGIDILAANTLVQGNTIESNVSDGVTIGGYSFSPAADNTIGGTVAGAGNVIANNGGAGVNVVDPGFTGLNLGNAILSNSIYGNAALGIDLGGDGVTMNHSGGLIPGPNGYENYPVLSSAVTSASQTTIDGSLNAAASETFTIQFFSNVIADPSGYGQGQTYLGSIPVTTNSSGDATFSATLNFGLTPGLAISATATDPNGNTSEFGLDVTLTDPPKAAVVRSGGPSTATVDQALNSLFLGVIDQATLNALAGTTPKAKPKVAAS
jgi:hypothetical protein